MRKYLSDLTGNGELRVSLRSLAGPVPCIVIKYVLKCKLFKINNIMNNNKMNNNLFLLNAQLNILSCGGQGGDVENMKK